MPPKRNKMIQNAIRVDQRFKRISNLFQAMVESIEGYIGLFLIVIISWTCERFDKDNRPDCGPDSPLRANL